MARVAPDHALSEWLLRVEVAEVAASLEEKDRLRGQGRKTEVVKVPLAGDVDAFVPQPLLRRQPDQMVAQVGVHRVIEKHSRRAPRHQAGEGPGQFLFESPAHRGEVLPAGPAWQKGIPSAGRLCGSG